MDVLKKVLTAATAALALPAQAAVAADVDRVEDVGTVVAVAMGPDFPERSLMRADCAFVQRVERPDGTSRETQHCQLSDEPVMIPAFQGEPPSSAFRYGGGGCQWISDYWFAVEGVDVHAASFRVVVTPSGHVHATSDYPAQPLVCP